MAGAGQEQHAAELAGTAHASHDQVFFTAPSSLPLKPSTPLTCTHAQVRCQRVIYGLLEDVEALLVGASPKVEHEVVAGAAEVLQVFQLKGSRCARGGKGWMEGAPGAVHGGL